MRSLLKLKPYLAPHLWFVIISGLLAIPLSALRAAPVPLVKYFIDNLLVQRDWHKLYLFPLLVIGLYLLNFVVRFFHYYLIRSVVTRINQALKADLFRHLLGLSAEYFTAQSTGTLISRVAMDTIQIDQGITSITAVIREPITFVVLLGYALKLNWKLTLVSLILLPPLAWIFAVTGKHFKRYVKLVNEENARVFSTLQEAFTGIRVIKMFRLEKYIRARFDRQLERCTQFILKTVRLEEATHPLVELLFAFIIALIVFFGGQQVLSGKMSPGDLMAFFVTFGLLTTPIRTMNETNIKLSQAAAACDRIFEIFSWKSSLHEATQPKPVKELRDRISMHDVRFAYPDSPSREVLRGINLEIKKGEVVALVGHSGSGKSSIANLMPRIFDVSQGSIRVDGTDIRELKLQDLRDLISVVSQEVFLFNDTIEENIRCGKLDATKEEVIEAARRARALEFIEKFPDGMATVVGDRGHKLSGGERQRISIARAFLREAPILILDEATSSLDSNSERAVQAVIDELMTSRTTLVIAHRLSTICNADQIIVLRDGKIIESGMHKELLNQGGEYAKLYQPA